MGRIVHSRCILTFTAVLSLALAAGSALPAATAAREDTSTGTPGDFVEHGRPSTAPAHLTRPGQLDAIGAANAERISARASDEIVRRGAYATPHPGVAH